MSNNKPKALVFKRRLLESSETFIREQVLSLSSWSYKLVGLKPVNKGLDLTGLNTHFITTNKIREIFCGLLGRPVPSIKKYFQESSYELIHLHFATQAVKVWPSIKDIDKPVFITLHGADISIYKEEWESGKRGWLNKHYPRKLLKLAESNNVTFIAVSQAIKQRAIDFGIPAEKIKVSYIGINTSQFQPSPIPIAQRPKKILFIGRFVEKKAPLLLIDAFAKVLQQVPDAELVMIGSGPLHQQAKDRADSLKVPVRFLGSRASDEVAEELKDTRVFCLPSVTAKNGDAEGFGIVILEAMASGVPVITSAKGGAHEGVVHNETGICFAENDLQELTAGLIKVLSDDALAQQFVAQGIERITGVFDNKITTKHLEDCYNEALRAQVGVV